VLPPVPSAVRRQGETALCLRRLPQGEGGRVTPAEYHARVLADLQRELGLPAPEKARVQMTELDVYCNRCGRRWTFAHVPAASTREHTIYAVCTDCNRSDQ
jgi:hypothetical protein